ncbi:MAG: hypothetical protein QOH49_4367 [Acidobacteriota bacterium]|jgi:hypothetical protein|nr:hypothetical protein [Acidobacteriota bacterium]
MMVTVVTTNNRRSALRAATAAVLLLLTLHAPARAQELRKQERVVLSAKEETVDSLKTGAGSLALVRTGEPVDSQMELRLNGKKVLDAEAMYAGFKAHFREMETGEVVVMWSSEGGTACPAQFRLIRVVGEGKVTVTEEFGDCGDSPTITLQLIPEEEITLRFQGYYQLSQESEPGFSKPPPTTWVYKKGVLRELKPAAKKKG